MNSPRLMPLNSSSRETSVAAGSSETFGIRGKGTLDQLSACRHRATAAVRPERQLSRRLPIHEHSVAHQMPAIHLHALVVESCRGEPAVTAVADQITSGAPNRNVPASPACWCPPCSLPSQRPIELGGVADGFVNGEEYEGLTTRSYLRETPASISASRLLREPPARHPEATDSPQYS
jgi:hypothetical protein